MKIAILGHSGSGKSTLARALGDDLNYPVLHLDQVQFTAGWAVRERAEAVTLVERFLDEHVNWIIDGNYPQYLWARRLAEADEIVLLTLGRWRCLSRVFWRFIRYRGTARPDMTDGCPEKLDWEFVRWVFWEGRKPGKYQSILANYPQKTVILRTQWQVDRYREERAC